MATTDYQIEFQEKEQFEKKLKWAKDFIASGIKHGMYDEEQFEGMTNTELVEFAEVEEVRSQLRYSEWKDKR